MANAENVIPFPEKDMRPDQFGPWHINFTSTNEKFAADNLPMFRVAVVTLNRDMDKARKAAQDIEFMGIFDEMLGDMEETAERFLVMAEIMTAARLRLLIAAGKEDQIDG